MNTKYIVIASNSALNVVAFGTKTGSTYTSEKSAERAILKLQNIYPGVQFLTLPIEKLPDNDKND